MSQRRLIYFGRDGSYTVGEWLVHWTWQYLINQISFLEYEDKIDYITPEMPGAMDEVEWDRLDNYLELLRTQP
jgi:hypothetical protein